MRASHLRPRPSRLSRQAFGGLALASLALAGVPAAGDVSDEAVGEAYVYLLPRALVNRQEQLDIAEEGIDYNVLKYNPVGKALGGWVNPNLDVANIEGWIAVDESTPALLEVPEVKGRYYTVQILDEWGEVITNINERNYPRHPSGKFVFTLPGSQPEIPDDAVRIDLRSPKAKLLARVEIQGDIPGAEALQKQFKLSSLGKPEIAKPVTLPSFNNKELLGTELFKQAEEILRVAPDVSPVAAQMQSKVRDVAAAIDNADQKARIDRLLKETVIPQFQTYATTKSGTIRNNWVATTTVGNYGTEYDIRAAANYVGIWANATDEVIYFVTTRDANGDPLDGSKSYVMDFPAAEHPDKVVNAYWSLSMVDVPAFVAVPNRLDRYTFNSVAPPPSGDDGSLKIFLAPRSSDQVPEANWLPAPDGEKFSLTFRTYVPKDEVKAGEWFPPAIQPMD